MKALIRDRILGIDSSGSQMGNYSPGNMLDDSTRNVWISSQFNDNVTLECNTQVNSFFIGNVRSDDIRYSYFKKEIGTETGEIVTEDTVKKVQITIELDGDKTKDNRPFKNGDSVRVRTGFPVEAHIETSPITVVSESYDDTTKKTLITASYVIPSGTDGVMDIAPTLEVYQKKDETTLKDIKTATRFYRNLGDFVQGIFVDAVSVFIDVPYDDQPTKIEVNFKNENDRRLNKAMYWHQDSSEGTSTSVNVSSATLSGVDGKVTIVEGSDHSLNVGENFDLKFVNHTSETTASSWSGTGYTQMPDWYDNLDFNGTHTVTEVIDNTTYKSERLIAPFTTVSHNWSNALQRFRNTANDDFIPIESSRGGFSRGRLTESPVSIQSIVYGSGIAQVQFTSPHGLVDGDIIIISGSSQALFNSSHQVTYVSSYTVSFTYNTTDLGSSGTITGSLFSYKPIDLTDFGVIKVGSHLLFNNSDSIMESTQIVSIRGTGTSEGDVKVRGDFASTSLDKIYTPIFGGIIKAGYSFDFPNAQVGLVHTTKDFSIKKELSTGAYHYLNRVTAKDFSGSFTGTPDQADRFLEFSKQQMGSPFAVNVLSDMNLNVTTSYYAYFSTPPTITYNSKIDAIREVAFNLKEVL